MNDKEKCNKCRCWRETNDFIKNEAVMKTCIICRDNGKKSRIVNADKIKEGLKKYYIENADKVKEQQKKYAIENADKIKEKQKHYRIENADKIKEQQKKHYIKNADKIKERKKKYCIDNADKVKEIQKKWRIDNANIIKETYEKNKKEKSLHIKFMNMVKSSKSNDKKKNRIYDAEDFIDYDFLNELWVNQNGKCYYDCCKVELSLDFNKDCRNTNKISIQRLDKDIAHTKQNCVLSCFRCNCVKHMENCDNE